MGTITRFIVQENMLRLVLVTVTGTTPPTDLSASTLVLTFVEIVKVALSSLTVPDLAAESVHADLTQDQMLVHLTTNALLLLATVVQRTSSTHTKALAWVTVTGTTKAKDKLVLKNALKDAED